VLLLAATRPLSASSHSSITPTVYTSVDKGPITDDS